MLTNLIFHQFLSSADKNVFIQLLKDFEQINEEEKETVAHVPPTSFGNNDPKDEIPQD